MTTDIPSTMLAAIASDKVHVLLISPQLKILGQCEIVRQTRPNSDSHAVDTIEPVSEITQIGMYSVLRAWPTLPTWSTMMRPAWLPVFSSSVARARFAAYMGWKRARTHSRAVFAMTMRMIASPFAVHATAPASSA